MMTPWDYIEAARVPRTLQPQTFGLWTIERLEAADAFRKINDVEHALNRRLVGFDDYTLLRRVHDGNISPGEIVMEDSARELKTHLPIWMNARGRVLVTGLGLGCVVRGLLANPDVDAIDVVEIDPQIVAVVGNEFASANRVRIFIGDALELDIPGQFDFAWHDLWSEKGMMQLHIMHAELFARYRRRCGPQGAWAFPRFMSKLFRRTLDHQLLGAPR